MSLRDTQDPAIHTRDGTEIRITPVQELDAAHVLEHMRRAAGETDYYSFGAGELKRSVEEQRGQIYRVTSLGGFMLQACVAREIVGLACVSRGSGSRVLHVAEFSIGVLQSAWGRGLGRTLCDRSLLEARVLGITRLELRVRADNLRALRLYESVGFVVEGRLRDAFKIGGVAYDELLMARLLGETLEPGR
jgi:RimJ/RimL family protein N-acetyltransferase